MALFNRRSFIGSAAAGPIVVLATGCADGDGQNKLAINGGRNLDRTVLRGKVHNPYDFGAVGDGTTDDSQALRSAYEAVVAQGGGTVELTRGRFYIPGGLEITQPGVDFVGWGGASVGGGEVLVGPESYADGSNGVDFSGARIHGIIFDQGDDYGTSRCLVLRNVRGLDISGNLFQSAGKGVAVETSDGNDKFHTTAMLRVSSNRFAKLAFGIYGNTEEWDRLSDWQIADNYFNYCSDTSIWIACENDQNSGGVDGLSLSGNTIFSLNYNSNDDPLFAQKRHNVKLGKTNWLRIINNNFFEAGLSAVYLDSPQNFTFIGNHVAWPGQRELADALEIRGGSPIGTIESNTFALWTRAAVGLYDLSDLTRIEVGQNGWTWAPDPNSWTGSETLPGYRVYANGADNGYPVVRDFQLSGAYDNLKDNWQLQSRDIKSPRGGVTGASRRGLEMSGTKTVFSISDIVNSPNFGGLITITSTNSGDDSLAATYLLFVSSQGAVCTVIESGGYTEGTDARHPSFDWALLGGDLQATPIGLTASTFNFDAVGLGAVAPT